jgi:hypothetical protein
MTPRALLRRFQGLWLDGLGGIGGGGLCGLLALLVLAYGHRPLRGGGFTANLSGNERGRGQGGGGGMVGWWWCV